MGGCRLKQHRTGALQNQPVEILSGRHLEMVTEFLTKNIISDSLLLRDPFQIEVMHQILSHELKRLVTPSLLVLS